MKRYLYLFSILIIVVVWTSLTYSQCNDPAYVWKHGEAKDFPVNSSTNEILYIKASNPCDFSTVKPGLTAEEILSLSGAGIYITPSVYRGPHWESGLQEGARVVIKPGIVPTVVAWRERKCKGTTGSGAGEKYVGPKRNVSTPKGVIPAQTVHENWVFETSSPAKETCSKVGYFVAYPQVEQRYLEEYTEPVTKTRAVTSTLLTSIRVVGKPKKKIVEIEEKEAIWGGVPEIPKK